MFALTVHKLNPSDADEDDDDDDEVAVAAADDANDEGNDVSNRCQYCQRMNMHQCWPQWI